ncbi:MAG TPA: type IX secretion system protein PorQ [Ignavibacteriaceae bacterium]|nr:type IX secretion system protein PorQ [Ignavibacteriaceae bacterium]
MKKTAYLFTIIFLLSISSAYSQKTFDFLRIDMSARAGALGGSFLANSDDIDVIFYNPAGLKMLSGRPASFSFVKYLLDINLASVAYSQEVGDIGRFGAAIKYINYGTFTEADVSGNKLGEFNAGELAMLVGYANTLSENFYYGANVKYIFSSIAGRSSSALALDLGLHYSLPEIGWDFGFSVLNAGTQLSSYYSTKEDLPIDIAFGVAKKMEHLPLRLYVDFHKLNEQENNFSDRFKSFSVGTEINLSSVLTMRLGYNNEKRKELKLGSFAGLAGLNTGLGILISDYRFDYGFSSMGQAGSLHRVSISTNF